MKRRCVLLAVLATGLMPVTAEPSLDPVFSAWQEQVDPAVDRALIYLQRSQNEDGSFPLTYGDSVGIPALAGMAILSKGYTPMEGPYAETLNRVLDYILNHQRDDGLFEIGKVGSGPMYAHNIATLFLSECSGMVDPERQARISRALPKALTLILRAQAVRKHNPKDQGGWRYHPNSHDSDTSCSGWALMALKSAKLNGAPIPDQAIKDAVNYLHRHQDDRGAFGYTSAGGGHAMTLTGMGLLCLELCGEHGSERTTKAADWLLKNFRGVAGAAHETYGNYYNAQGMFQVGGRHWQEYADWMYGHYLDQQLPDGSWDSKKAGPVYGTAMMVLAFTVPHRQLPIYQRDETVDEE